MKLLILLVLIFYLTPNYDARPPTTINKTRITAANCKIAVSKDSINGETINSAILESVLFFKITCLPIHGYCLRISNCYISSIDTNPYQVIDKNGCSTEKDLFENVEYLTDYAGFIKNPVPVKFRNSNDSITLSCDTRMKLNDKFESCRYTMCEL
uniref:ZP domain-containing protein n=1 Tax=Parastrongyloides trichosuri TaxID=131310 RepID=A0A0N4ZSW0_PARTI